MYEGQELNHAFGLCHYKHFLFWNEYRSGSIYKLDSTTGTVTLLRSERPPIFEIRMYDAQQQQGAYNHTPNTLLVCPYASVPTLTRNLAAGSNACRVNNGGCSSLCLATPGGRQCGCADDQILDPANNTSCKGACSPLSAPSAAGAIKGVFFSVPERSAG